ncbi:hypothetical protein ADICEAN_00538 [Cesiribacter andamanensis AMV16]|uniref:Uncharacterized protein n=1 Tax=Cesiribacter andamanensis AMV16 TaxID=1279009 RepID=M7NAH9_9BACT|nr:hypothetical protein ADICEAN_00538 [Cesiribacter andamanensis AMV16]
MGTFVVRAQGFGRIFDQHQTHALAEGHGCLQIDRVAKGVHGDKGRNAPSAVFVVQAIPFSLTDLLQVGFQRSHIHPQRGPLTVHKMGKGPTVGHGIGSSDKGKGRHQHLIARLYPGQQQADVQGSRTIDRYHRPLHPRIGRQVPLQPVNKPAHRGDPARIDALIQVFLFPPPEHGLMQRQKLRFRSRYLADGLDDLAGEGHGGG